MAPAAAGRSWRDVVLPRPLSFWRLSATNAANSRQKEASPGKTQPIPNPHYKKQAVGRQARGTMRTAGPPMGAALRGVAYHRRRTAMRDIAIIGVPVDLGAGRRGVDMGPGAIRYAGIKERLAALGHRVRDLGNIA